jgi:hypothetical protein
MSLFSVSLDADQRGTAFLYADAETEAGKAARSRRKN